MDESGAGLVHGGAQQQRNLEAVVHWDRAERGLLWRIQGPSVRHMLGLVFADCGIVYRYIKDSGRSASPQASRECTDGRNAKDTPEIHDFVQKTYRSFFRSIRSEPIWAVISIGTHDDQHDNCRVLHALLSETRLALLDRLRERRLLANLSRCALAKRHPCHAVSRRW